MIGQPSSAAGEKLDVDLAREAIRRRIAEPLVHADVQIEQNEYRQTTTHAPLPQWLLAVKNAYRHALECAA